MDFAPVDISILRRTAIIQSVFRNVAKRYGISGRDIDTLFQIYSLTTDSLKGLRASKVAALKLRAKQTVYASIGVLETAGYIERRKRIKSGAFVIFIQESGYTLISSFLDALKRAEREKFGARPDKQAQAKGGRISRKPKK